MGTYVEIRAKTCVKCENCKFGERTNYRMIICGKKNPRFQPEMGNCEYFKPKDEREEQYGY